MQSACKNHILFYLAKQSHTSKRIRGPYSVKRAESSQKQGITAFSHSGYSWIGNKPLFLNQFVSVQVVACFNFKHINTLFQIRQIKPGLVFTGEQQIILQIADPGLIFKVASTIRISFTGSGYNSTAGSRGH
jgi:hypothetical protein